MAVKLPATIRRRRSIALLAAAVAGSAIAVAGCGGGSDSGSSAGEVASYVPSTSPVYLEVTTDFDGMQWTQVEALAKQFPGYPELQRTLDRELKSEDVDFDTQIKPLLGERAAVAGLQLPDTAGLQGSLTAPDAGDAAEAADDLEFVAVVELADDKSQQVKDLLVQGGLTSRGERAGAEYFAQGDEDGVVAITDDALVFTDTEQQLFTALDAHAAGGGQTLAGTDKFTDALAKLPAEVFGQAYLDIGALVQRRRRGRGAAGPSSSAWTTTARPSWRRRSPPSPRARA